MKIKAVGLFHTPSGWPELESWIERHAPGERAHLITAACMAWNLAAKVQEMPEPEEEVSDERK